MHSPQNEMIAGRHTLIGALQGRLPLGRGTLCGRFVAEFHMELHLRKSSQ
jgi:hypothetical protein